VKRGSVRKLGPSSYRVRIEISTQNGKRRWDTKVCRSAQEAEKYRTKVLAALDSEQYVYSERLSFNELCDRYLDASNGRVEATTVHWYRRTLRDHIRPMLGDIRASMIRPLDVQAVLNNARDVSKIKQRRGKPLSAGSRKNLLVAMRAVFSWAVRMELLIRNPAIAVDLPKVAPRDNSQFDRESVLAVLTAIEGTEFEVLAAFALLTGARRGEIAALRWQDVDLDRGRYSIRRSAAILDRVQIYKTPKSKRSQRTEALPPSLVLRLSIHRKQQAVRHRKIGLVLPTKDTLVFDREDGSEWNVNELSRRWSRFVRKANLPRMRWHDLRHAFASLSHDAGESLHSISTALGHSSIGITSSTYVHTFDEAKRQRAGRLDAYIAPDGRDRNVTSGNSETSETV
jgi:integrase